MKTLKNAGQSIVIPFLSSLLVFLHTSAAEAGPKISDVQGKIQKIEGDIKFEKDWEKALKLDPYFTLDNKGNLHWGPALQAASMTMAAGMLPPQFAVGLPKTSPLTPDDAVAALNKWQQKNRKKMEENKKELKRLKVELKSLQKDDPGPLTESQKNARREFDALTARLNEHVKNIGDLEKIKAEYDKTELEMKLHIAIIEQAENEAERGNEIWDKLAMGMVTISDYLRGVTEEKAILNKKTAKLNKAYKSYSI